jgi:hypothetical protein
VEMYRPQLWKLDLSTIAKSRWNRTGARASWDEQYVADLKDSEFEIIVE